MVSKQPVMFTAAAIKDKSPTTQSLRRPSGAHGALQTAAWGGVLGGVSGGWGAGPCALTHTRTFAHLELTPTLNTSQKCLHYRATRAPPPRYTVA